MCKIKKDIYFSLVLCCYNSAEFIEKTIESIIGQSFKNWELIIINDGSTDDTEKIVKKYLNENLLIYYFYKNNSGYADARNFGITKCNGKWIAFVDHDDICLQNKLEIQHKEINDNPDCNVFFSNAFLINHKYKTKYEIFKNKKKLNLYNNKLPHKTATKLLIRYGCFILSSTVIINSLVLKKYKLNHRFKVVADYEFFCRISEYYNFYSSSKKLVKWKNNKNSLSNNSNFEKVELIKMLFDQLNKKNFYLKLIILNKIVKIFFLYLFVK